MTDDSLLTTPLHDTLVEMGGRMVEFAGWSMPVQFAGITQEHIHTRTACSVFDVSHMGRLKLTGSGCTAFLDRICTRNVQEAEPGRCYYSHICREDGGILDDVIVSCFETDRWGVVCNGANREKIVGWLRRHMDDYDVEMKDETTSTAMLAVQGPKTAELAQELVETELKSIKRYRCKTYQLLMMPITVYRTGYTGEDGFEVVLPAGLVKVLLPKLLGTRDAPHPIIKPAGLGARDTLRIEAGMPLYGHELSEDVDSLSAGQAWCVDLAKDFIGAEPMRKLQEQGLPRQLVGLELAGRRIARPHHKVYAGGSEVGEITSGTLSPTLGTSIAMAFVWSEHVAVGARVEVEVGKARIAARVVTLPFYKRPKKKKAAAAGEPRGGDLQPERKGIT